MVSEQAIHSVRSADNSNHTAQPQPISTIALEMSRALSLNNDETQKINVYRSHDVEATAQQRAADGRTNASTVPKRLQFLVKHWPIISQPLALLLIFMLIWGVGWSLFPEYAKPNAVIMRMLFLFVGAQICGIIVSLINLPDMLGMIFWGVFYRNIGFGEFEGLNLLESTLRELALVNIMLLAGLGLDLESLKKLFGTIMQLTLIPTIAETAAITISAYLLLDMPWLWGILLGLVVTAVSPNVVVTILLKLKEERLGMNKGIHTLIIAMTSCNDVIAIFCFGVLLGVIFSTGNLTSQLLQGPVGIGIGFAYGVASGVFLLYIPSTKSKYTNGIRFTMICLMGTMSVIGSKAIGYPSAGALGCIIASFVAGTGWRTQSTNKKYENNEVGMYLDLLWKFLKPISFSLIGKEVNFAVLEGNMVLYGFLTLLIGVIFRLVTSYFAAYGGDLNWKERAYVTIAGFPKATVQAALGPVALDLARQMNSKENYELANIVLVVSVLAIILTAPLGAILMTKLAPLWLKRSPSTESFH